MKEIQEIKNDIMLLKNLGNISKEVELVLLRKLTSLEKQLLIQRVSQQRELLLAFYGYIEKNVVIGQNLPEIDVNDFLANNCG